MQVIQSQLECLLASVETCDHSSKVLSGIVLCRCLLEISSNRVSAEVTTRLLSTMKVTYDKTESYYLEFDIVKSAVSSTTLK